ncbi:GIY-YIG nuclease family protein [Corallococcus interemptor]|uniref:GIY-YIG nuclease family protein n=1 Tax=Corallococcus interemptor TaxID=2316720 RepID=UPI00244B0C32|nr:GIY-YIG nuclease family protein [Corallococcus interemptor]
MSTALPRPRSCPAHNLSSRSRPSAPRERLPLENALHKAFANRRVNRINERKEFFRVSLDEVAQAVRKHHGEFELTRTAEAAEYRKTLALQEEEQGRTGERAA